MKDRRQFLQTVSAIALGAGGVPNSVRAVRGERADPKLNQQTETVTRFQQTAKLVADDGEEFDQFGSAVALSDDGTTALVGAHGDNIRNDEVAGSAYVFERSNGTWEQQQRLSADDNRTGDGFGVSVALSGDATTAVIGTIPGESDGRIDASVYIFERSDNSWHQQQELTANEQEEDSWLGPAVSVSDDGTTVITGVHTATNLEQTEGNDPPRILEGSGSVRIVERSDASWEQVATLSSDDAENTIEFGDGVALSGDGTTAVVGSPGNDPDSAGSVYIFTRSGSSWQHQQTLVPEDGARQFGRSVAASRDGTTVGICVPQDQTEGEGSGSAYVFEQSDESWQQEQQLLPTGYGGAFAQDIAVSGDGTTVFVGSRAADPNGRLSGAAYMFERSGEGWQQRITPDDGNMEDRFGESVAISRDGETALGGAFWNTEPHGNRAGSAYIFRKADVTRTPTPTPSSDTGNGFGPGFGIGTALAGLGTGVYLLTRRLADSNAEQD
jgi:PGF-CTERM protein